MDEKDQLGEEQLPDEGLLNAENAPENPEIKITGAELPEEETPPVESPGSEVVPDEDSSPKEEPVAEPSLPEVVPVEEVLPEKESGAEIALPEMVPVEDAVPSEEPQAELSAPEVEKAGISVTEVEPSKEEPAEVHAEASKPHPGPDLPPINVDYSGSSRQELVEALSLLLGQRTIHEITRDVENIRSAFYRKLNQESEEKHKKFLSEGGSEEEYKPAPDPLEDEFKTLYDQYRQRRIEYSRVIEEEKEVNLRKKQEIIEQIKNLLNTQESLNRTFNEFRDLQRQWREVGPVPQNELHSLWESYHHQVEMFYDYIKINKELRDLDLKKNMESKIQICEKAEELLLEPSVIKAFGELQKLHSLWREVGPVPAEKKDEMWERFREATNQINKKHQEYYLALKDEQKKNLDAKGMLCDKIEEILQKEVNNPKDWNDLSQEVVNLQKMWRSIGFAPRKDNNKIYDRFRAGCDEFFNRKREYFSRHRDDQHENLQLKTDLCVQAEALMNSTEWRKTTDELVIIQKKWKEVGPVPRKYSDALWHRFRTACDAFFQRKSEFFSSQDTEQVDNLQRKQSLIDQVANFILSDDQGKDLAALKEIQKEFTSIGHVPLDKKDAIHREFREAIHKLFDQLEVDESKKEILRYRQKVDNLAQSPKNKNRISSEREKLVNKLKQMESDIVLWENNIGFFAKSQKSESLIREVENKILQAKERIQLLKDKIDMLDKFES